MLKETFGVIIYQEQVMQIAQILSGYSLGEADLLRRAMGKKIKAEMDAQRDRFVARRRRARHCRKAKADEIFDLLAKFADYGFNKSHAAAYALIAYQTAWLKANYPVEFLAASMTLDKANTDKLAEFRQRGAAPRASSSSRPRSTAPASISRSRPDATARWRSATRSRPSRASARARRRRIVVARGEQPFAILADFAARINPREVNKKVLESLAAAGAFDELEPDRARVFGGDRVDPGDAPTARTRSARRAERAVRRGARRRALRAAARRAPWPPAERLQREFDAVGFFLSGHPLDAYAAFCKRLRVQRWADFVRAVKAGRSSARLAATVLDRAERRTQVGLARWASSALRPDRPV